MFHSKRALILLIACSLLAASLGQVVMLSAAPHTQSMRLMPCIIRKRIACSLQRHFDKVHAKRPVVSLKHDAI